MSLHSAGEAWRKEGGRYSDSDLYYMPEIEEQTEIDSLLIISTGGLTLPLYDPVRPRQHWILHSPITNPYSFRPPDRLGSISIFKGNIREAADQWYIKTNWGIRRHIPEILRLLFSKRKNAFCMCTHAFLLTNDQCSWMALTNYEFLRKVMISLSDDDKLW